MNVRILLLIRANSNLDNVLASQSSNEDSWAYGIEWLNKDPESGDNRLGACSFYDNSTYLFDFKV
jgi:hypothetical protein